MTAEVGWRHGQGEGSDLDGRDGSPDAGHGRGYCLEMICADFLAGAHLDNGNPRKRHERDSGNKFSPMPRSQIVRKPAAAGVTPGWMEVPALRRDVESRGSP